MSRQHPFSEEPSDTREQILYGTFLSLSEHGYAGLSLQDIADKSSVTKSSVYHFFDGKEDLLLAFLDFMIEQWRGEFTLTTGENPQEDLRAYLVYAATGSTPLREPTNQEVPEGSFPGPYVEVRAQAVNNDAYRRRFSNLDDVFAEELAAILERGIEDGTFREVDPEPTAEVLLTLLMGTLFRRSTIDSFDADMVVRAVDTLLQRYVLAEPASEASG